MMTFLTAYRAVLPIQKDALADMELHIAYCRRRLFSGAVAERAAVLGDVIVTGPSTHAALLVFVRLQHHCFYPCS